MAFLILRHVCDRESEDWHELNKAMHRNSSRVSLSKTHSDDAKIGRYRSGNLKTFGWSQVHIRLRGDLEWQMIWYVRLSSELVQERQYIVRKSWVASVTRQYCRRTVVLAWPSSRLCESEDIICKRLRCGRIKRRARDKCGPRTSHINLPPCFSLGLTISDTKILRQVTDFTNPEKPQQHHSTG